MKQILLILTISILISPITIFADNGVWHEAKDVKAGIFGLDENLTLSDEYIFNNSVRFFQNIYLDSASKLIDGDVSAYTLDLSQGSVFNYIDVNTISFTNRIKDSQDPNNYYLDLTNISILKSLKLTGISSCSGKLITDSSGLISCGTDLVNDADADSTNEIQNLSSVLSQGNTWGINSAITSDQGGSIELGGTGTPYIDFKNNNVDKDARLVLLNDNSLAVQDADLYVKGKKVATEQFVQDYVSAAGSSGGGLKVYKSDGVTELGNFLQIFGPYTTNSAYLLDNICANNIAYTDNNGDFNILKPHVDCIVNQNALYNIYYTTNDCTGTKYNLVSDTFVNGYYKYADGNIYNTGLAAWGSYSYYNYHSYLNSAGNCVVSDNNNCQYSNWKCYFLESGEPTCGSGSCKIK